MPIYTFELHDGDHRVEDQTGVGLPDRARALAYAHDVARELMRCREPQARIWRLDVYEEGERIYEVPFASIDRTLDHLRPELRATVEQSCERHRSVKEAIGAARVTARESRALVALSHGKPYLAAQSGKRTIRGAG
jgi:hypothetical protein